MKHIFLSLFALLQMAVLTQAQTSALFDFVDKHKVNPDFTYAFLSKDLFEVASRSTVEDQDWRKLQQVVRNLGSLRILAADSLPDAPVFYREALACVTDPELETLIAVKDGQDRVRVWTKESDGVVSDLVLLIGTSDAFVLGHFTGNLELGNLSDLAALLQAPEAVDLARTSNAVALPLAVFPNPTAGAITLQLDEKALRESVTLSVFDQQGRLLTTQPLMSGTTTWDGLREYANGIYWVQVTTQSGRVGVVQVQLQKN
jgi:Domain of unknown function (DUF4252)/Secretion system C-terminal sorting domain